MKQLTQEELNPMLDEHKLWLSTGDRGKRLVLEDISLDHINFHKHCLREAIFKNVHISNVSMIETDFKYSIFNHISIENSIITYCDFEYAKIFDTKLISSYFERCIIFEAIFENTSFIETNFTYNHMRAATLKNVDFHDCSLWFLELGYCNVENVTGLPEMSCPETGSFIGWKKVIQGNEQYIIKLEIPEDAKRSSGFSNKCRCDKARVLEIFNTCNPNDRPVSILNNNFIETIYTLDHMVYPDKFDDNRWNECSHGIHFFMTKEEAVRYQRP